MAVQLSRHDTTPRRGPYIVSRDVREDRRSLLRHDHAPCSPHRARSNTPFPSHQTNDACRSAIFKTVIRRERENREPHGPRCQIPKPTLPEYRSPLGHSGFLLRLRQSPLDGLVDVKRHGRVSRSQRLGAGCHRWSGDWRRHGRRVEHPRRWREHGRLCGSLSIRWCASLLRRGRRHPSILRLPCRQRLRRGTANISGVSDICRGGRRWRGRHSLAISETSLGGDRCWGARGCESGRCTAHG